MNEKVKLIRITTVPISLKVLLRNQLRFMANRFQVLAVASPGKELAEVGQSEGVTTASIYMTRAITPLQDLAALYKLYRFLKKEKPSIVHTHTPKAGLLGMMAGKMAGVPVRLHTVAGLPLMVTTGSKRKVLEKVEKITYACATKVYPNSLNLANFIRENKFCNDEKLKVIGNGSSNGIDTDFFKATEALQQQANALTNKYNFSDKDFVFVFVGRLVKDKGIEELVTSFVNLQKQYQHIKLLLVGPFEPELDPLSGEVQQLINENKDIISVGFQQDVRPFLLMSHVLAFPSYREGFPNVPMQAGCLNLPSIVTDINGCNEIIEQGQNGLIVPVRDAKALEAAMELLLSNAHLYHTLKANARKMITERFDQKYLWNLLLEEYEQQLKLKEIVS